MFGFFSRKKKDAKAAGKKTGKAKGGTAKTAEASKDVAKAVSVIAKNPAPQSDKKTNKKPDQKSGTKPDSLKAAIAALQDDAPPTPPVSAGAQLDKAKDALAKRAAAPMDRKALIEQALAIQQTQAKMLDKLPEATRTKLRDMAMKAFGADEPPKDKKKMN
jgi:hypothetical protein